MNALGALSVDFYTQC